MRPRVWTSGRRWLGNLIPSLFWFPPTVIGVIWIWKSGDLLGLGLVVLAGGQVIGWLALNKFGLWENGRIRRDSLRNLRTRKPPPPGPVIFVGASTAHHHSLLDSHEDVGFISFGPDELEFIGDKKRLRLTREQVRAVRFRPNVHTLLGLGRWISIEGSVEGRPVRLRIEPREHDTMLGNLAITAWLKTQVERWMAAEPLSP